MPAPQARRAAGGGGERFTVLDPATGEAVDEAPDQQPDELDAVVDRAHEAWRSWRTDPVARTTALLTAADAVEAAEADLAPLLTREQGKPLAESYAEVARTVARLRYFAELRPGAQPITDGRPVRSEIRWRSLGPVAAIVPWNFPLQLASAKFAPALAAGNTMVLKPSPFTPLASRLLGAVISTALPEGVLTIVTGREPLGPACVPSGDPPRDLHRFGSHRTGRRGGRGCLAGRVTLELGGNDAAVLLEDVDVERIADRLFWAAFRNCGQVCMAVKRVYAPARLCAQVAEALAQRAKSTVVGAGLDPARSWGRSTTPLSWHGSSAARPRPWRTVPEPWPAATGWIGRALLRPDDPGRCPARQPGGDSGTVRSGLAGAAVREPRRSRRGGQQHRVRAWRLGVGERTHRAEAVAGRLECGTAWINHHGELSLAQPFAGVKESGVGVAGGPWGLYGNLSPFVVHRPQEA